MLKTKCYTHMPHLPKLSEATVMKCMQGEYVPPAKSEPGKPVPQGFTFNPDLNSSKFVQDLQKEFGQVEIMCMSFAPHTIYDWHTDIFVRVRINYVLNDVGSALTLFKEPTESSNIIFNIDECKYTVGSATLFNSRVQHCVINNSDSFRYLLSIRFFDNTISFEQVEKFLLDYNSEEVL